MLDLRKEKRLIGSHYVDATAINVNVFNAIQGGAFTGTFISNRIHNSIKSVPQWRKHTDSERLTFESIEACHLTVDKVSKFSLRHYEIRKAFPQMREFYRFLEYVKKSKKKNWRNILLLI